MRETPPQVFSFSEGRCKREIPALAGLSRGLAEAKDLEEVLNLLTAHRKELGGEKVNIYLPSDGSLKVAAGDRDYPNAAKEDTIAVWTYQNGLPAGKGTGTLSWASGTYVPLKAHKATIGVIGLHFSPKMLEMPADLLETLETVGNLGAIALERFIE